MVDARVMYKDLFGLLVSLGFRDKSCDDTAGSEPRAFVHESTDTILLYRNAPTDWVSAADVLSTEVHLRGKGIVDQPLETLMRDMPVS